MAGDDFAGGSNLDDEFHGGSGNDEIFGNGGNDLIFGGAGNDYLDGGDDDTQVMWIAPVGGGEVYGVSPSTGDTVLIRGGRQQRRHRRPAD